LPLLVNAFQSLKYLFFPNLLQKLFIQL